MEKKGTFTELALKREISEATRKYLVILGKLDDLFNETRSIVAELRNEADVDRYFKDCADCYVDLETQVQTLMFENMAANLNNYKPEI